MYHALAKHGGMSLTMKCKGDLWIDDHHTADEYSKMGSGIANQYICGIYRIAQSPSERLSSKLSVKSAEFVDMELDLHLWMR
jgi:imidazoleglycerol phosphate dehydratase HisB